MLTAWVRKRALTPAPSEALARIEADTPSGVVAAATSPVFVREAWDRLDATLDLATSASMVRVNVGSPAAEVDRCLFIDDVTVVKVQPPR
jgi:mannosyltransferase OCH1-like enzyme